jgi:hypothetical protein
LAQLIDVMGQLLSVLPKILGIFGIELVVGLDLALQTLACISHEVPVVNGLYRRFECKRDEQAYRDRQQMQQEVFHGMNWLLWRMNVHLVRPAFDEGLFDLGMTCAGSIHRILITTRGL